MPTPSGRESASEKRERLERVRRAALNEAIAALPEGWAASEAESLMREDDAKRAAGRPWYDRAERDYASEPEAAAVSRAVKALSGADYVGFSMVFELLSKKAPVYRVEYKRPGM